MERIKLNTGNTEYRVVFVKKVYAYLDVKYSTINEIYSNQDELFSQIWNQDSFNYPDSDWEIETVKEKVY